LYGVERALRWCRLRRRAAARKDEHIMTRGFTAPRAHGVLDYQLAAVLIAAPLVIAFDYKASAGIALALGGVAVVQAVSRRAAR
jgi:hypothetical protein